MRLANMIAIVVLATCLVSNARERVVPLSDRVGDADAVIVGLTTEVRVVESKSGENTKSFLAVAYVKVLDVVKGPTMQKDEILKVRLTGQWGSRPMAELALDGLPDRKYLWLLEKEATDHADYLCLAQTSPAKDAEWGLFVEPFMVKAIELEAFSQLDFSLWANAGRLLVNVAGGTTIRIRNSSEKKIKVANFGSVIIESEQQHTQSISRNNAYRENLVTNSAICAFEVLPVSGFPQTGDTFEIGPKESVFGHLQTRAVFHRNVTIPVKVKVYISMKDRLGSTLVKSGPLEIGVEEVILSGLDQEAYDNISRLKMWFYLGKHNQQLISDQTATLSDLSQKYAKSIFAPAIKCGLLFAGQPTKIEDRIKTLQELSSDKVFGFAKDCQFELAKIYLDQKQQDKARALYPKLLESQDAEVWKTAIKTIDPTWEVKKKDERKQ